MTIFGPRTVVRELAMLTAICERCERRAQLLIGRRITRLTVLFIPLFVTNSWYFARCVDCGRRHPLRKAAAKELVARATDSAGHRPVQGT